jgi:hypothetical protein
MKRENEMMRRWENEALPKTIRLKAEYVTAQGNAL